MIGITRLALAGNMWNNAGQSSDGRVCNVVVEWSSRDMPEPLFAYLRLPLQFGLFYWAWALAKEFRKITSDVS